MTNDLQKQNLFDAEHSEGSQSPVECLGLMFPNDAARREHFLAILREKLKDPEFRKIEGFPIGSDEDILALSDPPYYTACPNPFIVDFIKIFGKPFDPDNDAYRREPFASDVSEGKNDPIYNAHSYHTKVPHKAIMRYILHYTEPGNIVFDGFCGTGMTGVAAQLCDDKAIVESLGYQVKTDGTIFQQETDESGKITWKPFSKLGVRQAILNDLSPAATFIAYNYNAPVEVKAFELEARRILKKVEDECGWMYETMHSDGRTKGKINYIVWSDVFVCPECTREVIFWEAAVDKNASKVKNDFPCPHCSAQLNKRNMERAWETIFDKVINQTIRRAKQIPVLISYLIGRTRFVKVPDSFDLDLVDRIKLSDIPYWFPSDIMPVGFNTNQPKVSHGLSHVHHFYTNRNLWILSSLFDKCSLTQKLVFQSISATLCSKLTRYNMGNRGNGPVTGTLYVGSMPAETNVLKVLSGKIADFTNALRITKHSYTASHSSTELNFMSDSIDYLFLDPPFGGNLMYSELNFIWEAWLKVFTNNKPEAIENVVQGKGQSEYQTLMTRCFQEYYRVLKPGRWMTVEFHNSQNRVWNAIQEALQVAGFVVADVRTLDKQQGSFKQVTSAGAVKQDLIISAYKPNGGLEERFKIKAGTDEGVWEFVRTHLKQLPIFAFKDGESEVIAERQNYMLYDRMLAFHVQRGVTIPVTAAEFYNGLQQRFPERDAMFFLPEQVAEYDRRRMTASELRQLELAPSDEQSAIIWLRQLLSNKPQTFQDIHPQFIRAIGGWQKYEKPMELSTILEENFLRYDGTDEVSSQIHNYLSSNYKELRNLSKDDQSLRAKAKHRWYVPDPNKQGDLDRLREVHLLKEFWEYLPPDYQRKPKLDEGTFLPGFEPRQTLPTGKKMKVLRMEAVRAGFRHCWQNRDYRTIIAVARRIPENVLQEDPKLLMWYDQAVTRMGEE